MNGHEFSASEHDPRCMLVTGPAEPVCDCKIWHLLDNPPTPEAFEAEEERRNAILATAEAVVDEWRRLHRVDHLSVARRAPRFADLVSKLSGVFSPTGEETR